MNQKRKIVRLNEATLKRIISESVREALAMKNSDGSFDWNTPKDEPYAVRVEFYSQEHSLSPQTRLVTPNESFDDDIVPLKPGMTLDEVEEMIHATKSGRPTPISDGVVELYHRMSDSQACQVGAVVLKVIDKAGNELGKPEAINWNDVNSRNTVRY